MLLDSGILIGKQNLTEQGTVGSEGSFPVGPLDEYSILFLLASEFVIAKFQIGGTEKAILI